MRVPPLRIAARALPVLLPAHSPRADGARSKRTDGWPLPLAQCHTLLTHTLWFGWFFQVVVALGDYMKIECMACIGGTRVADDMRRLESGVHCIVGTPGRVFDMINRRALQVNEIRQFVLDEADEMLSRGFKDQIYDIFRLLPAECQVGGTALLPSHIRLP